MAGEKGPVAPPTPEKEKKVELLSVADFDDMREKQRQLIMDAVRNVKDPYDKAARAAAKDAEVATFDERAKRMLIVKGAVTGEDDPTLAKKVAYIRQYSYDKMSEDDWLYDRVDNDGTIHPSGRRKVKEDFKHETKTDEPVDDKEAEPTEEEKAKAEEEAKAKEEAEKAAELAAERDKKIEALDKELKKAQGIKHTAFAKRMALGFFKRGKKRKAVQEEYDKAEAEYHKILGELELLRMDKHEAELAESGFLGPREEEMNGKLEERFGALMKSDDEAQREALLKAGGWKAKLMEKYINMNKRKKVMFMLGAGAVAAGLTVLSGGIGGVAGLFLGVGAGGLRSVKGFYLARSRLYEKKNGDGPAFSLEDKSVDRKEALRLALERMKGDSLEDIKDGDKKKKNAVLFGLGAAAIGSAATIGVGLATGFPPKPHGFPGGIIGDILDGPDSVPAPEKPEVSSWSLDTSDMAPSTPTVSPEMIPTDMSLRDGAGLYEQFGKIPGIEKEHYHDLWKAVGPDLAAQVQNGYGQPFAYEMNGVPGNWGIRMTPDHQMPQEAVDIITSKYQEMFGTPTGTGGVSEAIQNSDAITLNEADARGLENVIKMDTITPEAVAEQTGLMEKLSYATPNLSGERFAQHIGLPTSAWEGLQEYMTTQIEGNNRLYADYFYVGGDGDVRFTGYGDKLRPETVADMLQHIPNRNSFTLAG
jgi:hypothetical protein